MTRRRAGAAVALGAAGIGLLFAVVAWNSLRWVGTTFPGFLLMANRVVPSISLPSWPGAAELFQGQVVAVDGRPVRSAREVYDAVRSRPPGTVFTYTVRRPDGEALSATVASRLFSVSDFGFIHGALAVNGVIFAAIGLFVLYMRPERAASWGLLGAAGATGVFAITAADLYGPHWFFRLHVLAETFMAPAFIHLALVFPTDRLRRYRRAVFAAVYAPFVALAAYYQWALWLPASYTAAHLAATALHGVAVVAILAGLLRDAFGATPALVRRRVGIVGLGIVSGVVLPGTLMAASALLGGRVPINAGALTAFLFPLSLGYAIIQHNLFEIDQVLRRGITYLAVLVAVTSAYFVALFAIGLLLPANETLAQSPATNAIVNLGVLLLVAPTRDRVRHGVDKIFFRAGYDAEQALGQLSQRLATARAADDVSMHTLSVIADSVSPARSAIALYEGAGRFTHVAGEFADASELVMPADLTQRLAGGGVLARYEWEDGSGQEAPPLWRQLDAEIIVPIRNGGLIGVLILGGKGSGRAYTIHDLALLQTIANQVVLAMVSATAFGKLEEMNEGLEQQVRERTVALEGANEELHRSIEDLRHAYELLERNQASLLRADRLATLGRLAAGMAHEISTPLGAVLNSLKLVLDLADEYTASIDDHTVLPADHHQIAAEIRTAAESAATWARKAAAFLGRTKLQGRELPPGVRETFAVRAVAEETCQLLAYRARAAACTIDYTEAPEGVALVGDQQRLGQVLVNLVNNAIDAYEDNGVVDGRIEIHARRANGSVRLTVRDWAGGIPEAVLPCIFDELFTTKEPGKGVGLGLWIARNLIEVCFGGQLTVESVPGVGTCFTAAVKVNSAGAAPSVAEVHAAVAPAA